MNIDRLLNPRSIAVFGGNHARALIRQCDLMEYSGEIWPVHPGEDEMEGRRVFHSVEALPGVPDAAYLAVNRHLTIDIVRKLRALGAGGVVCYASGFGEAGEHGELLAADLLEAAGDMPLIGPNGYGFLNYIDGAMLWPDQQGGQRVDSGVAVITQSSNIGFNLTMQRRGLPLAYLVSLGNRLQFDVHDAIRVFAEKDEVTAIGLFLETIADPRAFQDAVNAARDQGKPVVALKVGRSRHAQRIVKSHTASLAGSDELVSGLFRDLGVARVDCMESLVETLKLLHVLGPLEGKRVGAMSTSGGDLILLADALEPDLDLPAISDEVARGLEATLHERIVAANPLDYQMFDWNDEPRLSATFEAFLAAEFDIALCLLDYPREDRGDLSGWSGAERAFVSAARGTGTPGVVLSTYADNIPEMVAARLMDDGIAPLCGIAHGVAAVRAAVEIGEAWKSPPRPGLLCWSAGEGELVSRTLDEAQSKAWLSGLGIPVPEGRVAHDANSAAEAATALGFPVAVKTLGLSHKTEAGGVRLGVGNGSEVAAAVAGMASVADRYLVEKMIEGAVSELIVGVARDSQFGPYIVLGSGGVLVEVIGDNEVILPPAGHGQVMRALRRLRCWSVLNGFRGRPAGDLEAVCNAVMALAESVTRNPGRIVELDINPLMVLPEGRGVMAADALVCLDEEGPRHG